MLQIHKTQPDNKILENVEFHLIHVYFKSKSIEKQKLVLCVFPSVFFSCSALSSHHAMESRVTSHYCSRNPYPEIQTSVSEQNPN